MVDKINPHISSLPTASGVVRKPFQNENTHNEKKFDQKKRKKTFRKQAGTHNVENDEYSVDEKENRRNGDSIDIFI